MKKIILLSVYCFYHLMVLSAQDSQIHVVTLTSNSFSVGDMTYAKSYKGLKYFMEDTKNENPELYQKLLPSFNRIRDKHSAAVATFTSTAAIGTTILVVSIVNAAKVSTSDPSFEGKVSHNLSGYFLGGGIVLGGLIVAAIISPEAEDIYQFINLHNRNSANKKIDWGFGINLNPRETVKLTCNF